MLGQLKEMLKQVIADDELFALTAEAIRKNHQALIKAGFSEDEAIKIVAVQGMGVSLR